MADQDRQMKHAATQVSTRAGIASNALQNAFTAFGTFWQARAPREQKFLLVATVVVFFGTFYALLIDPALSGRAALQAGLPELRQQLAQMQTMTRETAALGNNIVDAADVGKRELESTLARKGLRAQTIAVTDDAIRIQMNKVAFSDVVGWLHDAQKELRLTVSDAAFSANGETDFVDARLTLQRLKKTAS